MVKQPDIDEVLAFVLRDPKNTTDFLLGTICGDLKSQGADICTIKDRQTIIDKKIDDNSAALEKKIAAVQLEVDEIKADNAFNKGFIAAIAAVGGTLGVGIVYIFKFIYTVLFTAH